MITSLRLKNFKNFKEATVSLGAVTTLVGANGSGKSNIFDAFLLLKGLATEELIEKAFGEDESKGWPGIRGGAVGIARQSESEFQLTVTLQEAPDPSIWIKYHIGIYTAFLGSTPLITEESISAKDCRIERGSNRDAAAQALLISGEPCSHAASTLSTLLSLIHEFHGNQSREMQELRGIAERISEAFTNTRHLDFQPEFLRKPCEPSGRELGARGEKLSGVLFGLKNDPDPTRWESLLGWLRMLLPSDVVDITFPKYSGSRIQLALVEADGRETTADAASDGTLRFLGYLGALLTAREGDILFFEEIENGIHPARLALLVELIESQAKLRDFQVVLTTHSPTLLDCLSEDSRSHTHLIYRDTEGTSGEIARIVDLPNVHEVLESEGLGSLLTTRWLEQTLYFSLPAISEKEPAP